MSEIILIQEVYFKDGKQDMISANISMKLGSREAFRLAVGAEMARVRSGGAQ